MKPDIGNVIKTIFAEKLLFLENRTKISGEG